MASTDEHYMAAAIALSQRGRGLSTPNPNVGCILVGNTQAEPHIIGRGWTQAGGRPHAEAMALDQASDAARGSTAYVTLEPCAHASTRGPMCAESMIKAGVARVVIAAADPDPRTNGAGVAMLRAAGIEVREGILAAEARDAMAGYFSQRERGRPFITLKIATSLDGCIALSSGESQWITGAGARAHGHLERARNDMILIGGGTLRTDKPALNVRLAGLEDRSPIRAVLTHKSAPQPKNAPQMWHVISAPHAVHALPHIHHLLLEGGAGAAAAFLREDLVDRLLLYRAPILIGGGTSSLGDIGLNTLSAAHDRWTHIDTRQLGADILEIYERNRLI